MSADKISVEEAAGDSYAYAAHARSVELLWCDQCNLSTVQRIRRVLITVDPDGVTLDELGRAYFCLEHQGFVR